MQVNVPIRWPHARSPLSFLFVGRAERVLDAKAVADNLPFVRLRGDHERLLELLGLVALDAGRPRHHDQQRFLRDGRIDDRLRVQRGDGVLGAGQLLEEFLDVVFAGGAVAVPHGHRRVQIEPRHLLDGRRRREARARAKNPFGRYANARKSTISISCAIMEHAGNAEMAATAPGNRKSSRKCCAWLRQSIPRKGMTHVALLVYAVII